MVLVNPLSNLTLTVRAVRLSRPWLRVTSRRGTAPSTEAKGQPCPRGKANLLSHFPCLRVPGWDGVGTAEAGQSALLLAPGLPGSPFCMHTAFFEVSLGFCGNFIFVFFPLVSLVTSKTNTHTAVSPGSQLHFSSRHLGLETQQDLDSRNPNSHLTPSPPFQSVPRSQLDKSLLGHQGERFVAVRSTALEQASLQIRPGRGELCSHVFQPCS